MFRTTAFTISVIMKNLITRSITGLLFVGIIIGAIWYSQESFRGLILIATILCLSEFYRLTMPDARQWTRLADILGGTYLVGIMFLFAYPAPISTAATLISLSPYIIYLLYTFIVRLYLRESDPITSWAKSLLGQIYIALPMALLSFIAYTPTGNPDIPYNALMVISFFTFIWINDTGAYCVGCTIGRHRLFERISPKKSWEGFWGGFVFALALGWVWSQFLPVLNLWQWLGLAATISVFSTLGDLCESLLKRTLQVKDSGAMLPGHGGMLDRLDSVMIASPAAVIYLTIVMNI